MKLKIRIAAIVIFCVSIVFNLLITSEIMAASINVAAGANIQAAVTEALNNIDTVDYVYIAAGTFEEQIIIVIPSGREIHLIGSGPDSTIISLPSGRTGNVISADGGGKIYIEGMKITKGTRSGIRINNSTELTIQNCKISNNTGNIGGGIYNYGSILIIDNSTISNNSGTLYGGGIYSDGTLTITNSKLIDNTSPSGQGGAIYNLGNLTVSNSSISNNSAASYSGIASIGGIPGITNTAANNWWGTESGPYNATNNPLGTGNSVADDVSFSSFLTSDPFIIVPPDEGNGSSDDPPPSGDENITNPEDNLPPDEGSGSENGSSSASGSENNNQSANNSVSNNSGNILGGSCLFYQGAGYFSLNYYLNSYGSPAEGFVTLLYHSILEREPDIEGLNYWQQILESKSKNASYIAKCLFFSEENISKVEKFDNDDFIKYLYQSILFREYDIGGHNDWLRSMNAGAAKQYLFNAFTASKEWSDICTKFGVNP